jgi:hypothetical protein
MKRTVSVEATVSFDFEVDDEVVSDWDGATVLDVLDRRKNNEPAVYTEDATQETLLGHLGIVLCVEGRSMGNIDGWADFPSDAASGNPYGVHWTIESVEVSA